MIHPETHPPIHTLRNGKLSDNEMKAKRYLEHFSYYYTLDTIKDLDAKISQAALVIESDDYSGHDKSIAMATLSKLGKIYASAHL